MKTKLPAFSVLGSASLLGLLLAFSTARVAGAEADTAVQLLAEQGVVPVRAAGPYVEVGTFRVQVLAKLGQPDIRLADGTWLYHRRRIENSNATGSLIVQFKQGRVNSLSLATPAVVATLEAGRPKSGTPQVVAAR